MQFDENTDEMYDFDHFCSILSQLKDVGDDNTSKEFFNSISNLKKMQLLFSVVAADKPLELKNEAISLLNSTFSFLRSENALTEEFMTEITELIKNSLIVNGNKPLQKELLSILADIIVVLNEEKMNKLGFLVDLAIQYATNQKLFVTGALTSLFIDFPFLFGKIEEDQLVEYKRFCVECLQKYKQYPKVAALAIQIISKLPRKYESSQLVESFSKKVPLIIKIMKELILTNDGLVFMENLNALLFSEPKIFKNYMVQIIPMITEILENGKVETIIFYELYKLSTHLMSCFPYETKKYCLKYVSSVVETLINFQVNMLPSNPEEWFFQVSHFNDKKYYRDDRFILYRVGEIITAVGRKNSNSLLYKHIFNLLESSNWKCIDTALEILTVVIRYSRRRMLYGHQEILRLMNPHFSSNNPKISCSIIKAIDELSTVYGKKLSENFHVSALKLILDEAEFHDSTFVRCVAADSICSIIISRRWNIELVPTDRIFNVFALLLDSVLIKYDDVAFVSTLLRCVCYNISNIYYLAIGNHDLYLTDVIRKFLNILNRIIHLLEYQSLVNSIVNCLTEIIEYFAKGNIDNIALLILQNYRVIIDKHKGHLDFSIHPYFLPLFIELVSRNSTFFSPLLPDLIPSYVEVLGLLSDQCELSQNRVSTKPPTMIFPDPLMYCCYTLIETSMSMVCQLFSWLAYNIGSEFSVYVQICLESVHQSLKSAPGEIIYPTVTNTIYILLNCGIIYGNSKQTNDYWIKCVKDLLMETLNKCTIDTVCDTMENFTKCYCITGFRDILTFYDADFIGEVLNRISLDIFERNNNILKCKQDETLEFDLGSPEHNEYHIGKNFTSLMTSIQNLLPSHKQIIPHAVHSMSKTLVLCQDATDKKHVIQFLIGLFSETVDFMQENADKFNELLETIFKFCFSILPMNLEDDLLESANIIVNKIKIMNPTIVEE